MTSLLITLCFYNNCLEHIFFIISSNTHYYNTDSLPLIFFSNLNKPSCKLLIIPIIWFIFLSYLSFILFTMLIKISVLSRFDSLSAYVTLFSILHLPWCLIYHKRLSLDVISFTSSSSLSSILVVGTSKHFYKQFLLFLAFSLLPSKWPWSSCLLSRASISIGSTKSYLPSSHILYASNLIFKEVSCLFEIEEKMDLNS